jgi:hypothetical protein
MSFVQVQHGKFDPEGLQDCNAPYPEHNLLTKPLFNITGIEMGSDSPVPGIVFLNIRIKKIKGDTPHVHLPYRYINRRLKKRDRDNNLLALLI